MSCSRCAAPLPESDLRLGYVCGLDLPVGWLYVAAGVVICKRCVKRQDLPPLAFYGRLVSMERLYLRGRLDPEEFAELQRMQLRLPAIETKFFQDTFRQFGQLHVPPVPPAADGR